MEHVNGILEHDHRCQCCHFKHAELSKIQIKQDFNQLTDKLDSLNDIEDTENYDE
jgi:hypothetical protein